MKDNLFSACGSDSDKFGKGFRKKLEELRGLKYAERLERDSLFYYIKESEKKKKFLLPVIPKQKDFGGVPIVYGTAGEINSSKEFKDIWDDELKEEDKPKFKKTNFPVEPNFCNYENDCFQKDIETNYFKN